MEWLEMSMSGYKDAMVAFKEGNFELAELYLGVAQAAGQIAMVKEVQRLLERIEALAGEAEG